MNTRCLGKNGWHNADGLEPLHQLTGRYQFVHIVTGKVIWSVVSSVHLDSAAAIVSMHKKRSINSRGAALLTVIDERTQAFRDWIADMLAHNRIGITELARLAGVSHSTLSRAMNDNDYRINFRADTIEKLALAGKSAAPTIISGKLRAPDGFAEAEATHLRADDDYPASANQSLWSVKTSLLTSMGLMPGDKFIIDNAITAKNRDIVLVQEYDNKAGTAQTLLRVFMDGFAVTPMHVVDGSKRIWLDGTNGVIMGVLTRSWRTRD